MHAAQKVQVMLALRAGSKLHFRLRLDKIAHTVGASHPRPCFPRSHSCLESCPALLPVYPASNVRYAHVVFLVIFGLATLTTTSLHQHLKESVLLPGRGFGLRSLSGFLMQAMAGPELHNWQGQG